MTSLSTTPRINSQLERGLDTASERDAGRVPRADPKASPRDTDSKPTVLVITDYDDVHADAVIEAMNIQHVPVYRLNTSDLALQGRITLEVGGADSACQMRGEISNSLRRVCLQEVRSVWYRRPRRVATNPAISANAQPYAQEQFRLALQYLQGSLDARWVNHPAANRRAENKILQLSTAQRLGFLIPDTILTNSPQHLDRFRAQHADQELIVKDLDLSMANAKLLLRGIGTQSLPGAFFPEPDTVTAAPVIVQPFVPKAFELRCTVIGDRIFAVRIDSPEFARLDWRSALTAGPDGRAKDLNRYSAYDLPHSERDRILAFCDELELRFAAIDLIVSPEEEYVFLEVNPNGQWLWLQWEAHVPLIEAMVDELSH